MILLQISDCGLDCRIAIRVIAKVCLPLQGVNVPLEVGLVGLLILFSADDFKELEPDSGLGLNVIAFGRGFSLQRDLALLLLLAFESLFEYVDILALFNKTLD